MNRQEIESGVVDVISGVLKCDVDLTSSRDNLYQWDSLKHIEIVFALEDEMGIRFAEEELAELDSVSDIVERITARHEA